VEIKKDKGFAFKNVRKIKMEKKCFEKSRFKKKALSDVTN